MKKSLIAGSSIFLLMGLYNILVFCLCKEFTKNFWTGYIFIMLAFVILLVSFILSKASKRDHHTVGLPLTTLSLYYFILEIILGSLLMFFKISWFAVFLPQIIVFMIFLMIYFPALINFLSLPKVS